MAGDGQLQSDLSSHQGIAGTRPAGTGVGENPHGLAVGVENLQRGIQQQEAHARGFHRLCLFLGSWDRRTAPAAGKCRGGGAGSSRERPASHPHGQRGRGVPMVNDTGNLSGDPLRHGYPPTQWAERSVEGVPRF